MQPQMKKVEQARGQTTLVRNQDWTPSVPVDQFLCNYRRDAVNLCVAMPTKLQLSSTNSRDLILVAEVE